MPDLLVDGRPVSVPEGATLLQAARVLGIRIPTLCFEEGLPHHTSCMVCLVEDKATGHLVPACATPVAAGQAIRTEGEAVRAARRRSLELLLSEHAGDCEAPCARACPAHADIPGMIRRWLRGDAAGALTVLLERLPLAGTLAYICPAPCESACRRRLVDAPVAIRALKKAVTARASAPPAVHPAGIPAAPSSGRRVAIVGAGPAGLAAAYFLARAGHRCRVLDEQPEPGGALPTAVGADRLPPEVLAADVAVLQHLGVELDLARAVGPQDLAALRAGHDAVVLAVGSPDRLADLLPAGAGSLPDVFAGGNATAVQPSRLAVRAVAAGRELARTVDAFLGGRSLEAPRFDSRLGRLEPAEVAAFAASLPADVPATGLATTGLPAPGLPGAEEAARCLSCDCARRVSCRLRGLADELEADARRFPGEEVKKLERLTGAGGLSFEPGKCIKCGLCVRIAERGGDRPGLAFTGRGFDLRLRVPFNEDIGTALPSTAAECVAHCPTGALTWGHR